MNKIKYIKITISILLLCVIILCMTPMQASAAAVNTEVDAFNNYGNLDYVGDLDAYSFDIEETDLFESKYSLWNGLANIVFDTIKTFVTVTIILFHQCMNLNLGKVLEDYLNTIQQAMHTNLFEPLFYCGICGSAVIIIINLIKRDLIGSYLQLAKIIGIWVLSLLIVRDSASVLSEVSEFTRTISLQVLITMQGGEVTDPKKYTAQACERMWTNMVHVPWHYIQFGGEDYTEGYEFLKAEKGSEDRAVLVAGYEGNAFAMERAESKLAFCLMYWPACLIKCLVYVFMALISLGFQVMAVFFVIIAPLILVITMFPDYEHLLSGWTKKVLETQFSVLLITFVIGLVVSLDNILYDSFADEWGWLVVIYVQAIIAIMLIWKHEDLLEGFGKMKRRTATAHKMQSALMRTGDGVQMMAHMPRNARYMSWTMNRRMKSLNRGLEAASKVVQVRVDASEVSAKKQTVERPVMNRNKKAVGENTTISSKGRGGSNARNASVRAQKAQQGAIRPRMENLSSNSKIVQIDDFRTHNNEIIRNRDVVMERPTSVPEKNTAVVDSAKSYTKNQKVAESKPSSKVERPNSTHETMVKNSARAEALKQNMTKVPEASNKSKTVRPSTAVSPTSVTPTASTTNHVGTAYSTYKKQATSARERTSTLEGAFIGWGTDKDEIREVSTSKVERPTTSNGKSNVTSKQVANNVAHSKHAVRSSGEATQRVTTRQTHHVNVGMSNQTQSKQIGTTTVQRPQSSVKK